MGIFSGNKGRLARLAAAATIVAALAGARASGDVDLSDASPKGKARLRDKTNQAAADRLIEQAKKLIEMGENAKALPLMQAAEGLRPGCVASLGGGAKTGQWQPPAYMMGPHQESPLHKSLDERDADGGSADENKEYPAEWDALVQSLVRTPRFERMMSADASKMQGICSRFPGFQEDQKAAFWSAWLEAIARTESGLMPRKQYEESFKDDNGKKQISAGLLQMSVDDWKKGCGFKSLEDVYDPFKNLECGLITMNVLWNSRDTALAAAQRYWSVTRPEKPGGGHNERYDVFRKHLNKALAKHSIACETGTQ